MSSSSDALSTAAATENAAIFTYGVITAFVSAARRTMVDDYIAAHRVARDAVDAAITRAGGQAPLPSPGYTLPREVTDPLSAARAALVAENDCTTAYRALLEQADSAATRTLAVDGLTAAAQRGAQWRVVLGDKPATVPFPGGSR